jgi:homoserine O-acetyltransferase/O-succinyltransferase
MLQTLDRPKLNEGDCTIVKTRLILVMLLPLALMQVAHSQEQQLARIGDLRLESGKIIRDCVIGYRTFGKLNRDKSNVVLFPTAFGWRSAGLASRIGPGKLIDAERYFVIVVDSLGDGISSSPSNSSSQPGLTFPEFSIRDLVTAEQQLVVGTLHLRHVRAVLGFSMGGMQAFQWAVSYPGFMDKVVSIVGSPQLTAYDLLLWRSALLALESDPGWKEGRYDSQPTLHLMNMLQMLALLTPQYVVSHNARSEYQKFESELVQGPDDLDANDTMRQIQALLSADVAAPFDGSLQGAAATVRSQMLVIVNKQDHTVNPQPAADFARMLHAPLLELDSDCGHRAHNCEMKRIGEAVAEFLEK